MIANPIKDFYNKIGNNIGLEVEEYIEIKVKELIN